MSRSVRLLAAVAVLTAAATSAYAQTRTPDLFSATLEELMRIEVTSVSRHQQRAEDVPAAVYVMTQDEIHRSGMTTIPDLLRLVPGVQVAQANSNKWAVSVRGFNGLASNKTLVMVDGRSIYNPAFSTVLWDTEDLLLEDIDRIEVVRGPGGAMWGANAVNGVINIITKPSAATQGVLARVSTGTFDTAGASVRYGGTVGPTTYRVFAQAADHGDSTMAPGTAPMSDRWRTITSGLRGDWSAGAHALMLQASASNGRQRPLWFNLDPASLSRGNLGTDAVSESSVGAALGRWTYSKRGGPSLQLQGFFDQELRDETVGLYHRHTWDIDAQYHHTLAHRHDIVAGGGYRQISETLDGRGGYLFTPHEARPIITNGFAQDAITLVHHRLELTVGTKFENNTFAGSSLQPSTRLLWTLTPSQRVWASAARAIRTPSLIDRGLHVEYPPTPQPNGTLLIAGAYGNQEFRSEHFANTEGGYRLNVASVASIDIVGFAGRYDDLQTFEPQTPQVGVGPFGVPVVRVLARAENRLRANTAGAEFTGRVELSRAWGLDGTYSRFRITPHPNGSIDPKSAAFDGNAPGSQWRVHSGLALWGRGQADVHLFHVGALQQLNNPAYTRLDARIEWPLTSRVSIAGGGQNLLQHAHQEFDGHYNSIQSTLVPRSGLLQLTWRF
jgi:iron complex outermembrane receptor protein